MRDKKKIGETIDYETSSQICMNTHSQWTLSEHMLQ
jgi:hypothetical protein